MPLQREQDMKISDRAKQGFDQIVQHCMRTTLVPSGYTVSDFETLDAHAASGGVVMLTVASSTFSLTLFLHYDTDATSRAKLAALHGLDANSLSDQALDDALAEAGNMFCGALNRELGRIFPLVGMSTPNRLKARCVDHLKLLRYGHLRHFRMSLQDGSDRRASYCICAYGDVDFAPQVIEEDVGTGELELF